MAQRIEDRREEEASQSFSYAAREVLEWQGEDFQGEDFERSNTLGKETIREAFTPRRGAEDVSEKLITILAFLVYRMKLNDNGRLKAAIERAKGERISVLPMRQAEPAEILHKLLGGEYDKNFGQDGIAGKGEAYTMALYLYMNTSGKSEDEMINALAQLVANYDNAEVSQYVEGIDGLRAEPFLAELCKTAIEKNKLQAAVRAQTEIILKGMPEGSGERNTGQANLNRVIPPEK